MVVGALVSDHELDLSSGTYIGRYERSVLENLTYATDSRAVGRMPGGWLDYYD